MAKGYSRGRKSGGGRRSYGTARRVRGTSQRGRAGRSTAGRGRGGVHTVRVVVEQPVAQPAGGPLMGAPRAAKVARF